MTLVRIKPTTPRCTIPLRHCAPESFDMSVYPYCAILILKINSQIKKKVNPQSVICNFYLIGNKISFNKRTYHIFILLL